MGKKRNQFNKNRDDSLIKNKEILIEKLMIWCILASLLLIPTFLRGSIIDYIGPSFTDIPDISTGEKVDIFSYGKYQLLIFFTTIISLLFIIKVVVYNHRITKNSMNVLIGIFIILVLLSSMFATYKFFALRGIHDRSEGAITYLCYGILLFIVSNTKIPKRYLKWILFILIPFTIINSIIGLLNFYGINLLKQKIVLQMIYGKLTNDIILSERAYLAGTLDQGNYLSGISSMLFMAFFILAILCKNIRLKIINIISLLMSFSILLASLSNSGFITISLLVPVFLIMLAFYKKYKEFVLGLLLILSLSIVFIPMNYQNERVWNETFGNYTGLNPFSNKENIANTGEKSTESGEVQSRSVAKEVENFIPKLPDPGVTWGSGRGYLWKTTLPLISQRPIFGYGLDTFAYHFPQNDKNMIGGIGTIAVATKPHSLYLDIAFGMGVVGLLVFLMIVFILLWKSFKKILSNKNVSENKEILAISFILLAYLIQGIVNDSIIGVSVIFYILLGVLTSELNRKDEKCMN